MYQHIQWPLELYIVWYSLLTDRIWRHIIGNSEEVPILMTASTLWFEGNTSCVTICNSEKRDRLFIWYKNQKYYSFIFVMIKCCLRLRLCDGLNNFVKFTKQQNSNSVNSDALFLTRPNTVIKSDGMLSSSDVTLLVRASGSPDIEHHPLCARHVWSNTFESLMQGFPRCHLYNPKELVCHLVRWHKSSWTVSAYKSNSTTCSTICNMGNVTCL